MFYTYTTTRLEELIEIRHKIDRLINRVEKARDKEKTYLVRFFCDTEDMRLVKLYEEKLTLNQRDRLTDVLVNVFRGMSEK